MKAKEIQELIDFISNSGLAEVKIETDEFKLSIKKHAEAPAAKAVENHYTPIPAAAPNPEPATQKEAVSESNEHANRSLLEVKSPMIGTFYRSANPDADFFVNIGDTIQKGQTVCIIEAMKLFNEVESEISGKVVKVLVEDASPVEYDQPLFLIEPQD
ncbi:acetyl-CoA carboxylase biotin carboxyl carrier protein [Cyclobacterium lianum]|uniref:Biotin carboxyl carrier protein of acetyl-CoA carboxylase n=1 Tax=Cyclobacterium lianum TaxID=388280 RepID=A0A1M7QDE1_9BACT|nr:acetyl-CoA carboxylase biotin carboxyl carrier protein [Cyclobacterium lianum]SHN28802.1 acetyl-CoA carboxylase biotin carboxyl carrier protein [Cyclobacterium lianum]